MPLSKYSIFDKMIEGIQIVNPDWIYLYVNDTVALHGKYSKKELLGHTMMERYSGIENTEMFAQMQKCLQEQKPHQMINEFDFPDGSKGYFELRMQPVEEGIIVMSFDVTKQKLAEQFLHYTNAQLDEKVKLRTSELMSKNKELEQFTYIASHDLQEPLRTISNYIEVLQEDYGQGFDPTALGYLEAMGSAAKRMSLLAKSLLDYSRLGLHKKLKQVNCQNIVQEVVADLQNQMQKSEAKVTVGILPTLAAYETELRQLFQNLISNALKFRKEGVKPEINIQAKEQNIKWEFSVVDNGIGIDPLYFGRIFQIFQRLHLATEYEGSGIGLAHCKKIAELHGGEISVQSEPKKGSTFVFTISKFLSDEQKSELHPSN